MNRKIVMLGVAGDSASGKTTISKGIVEALGADQVTAICCDHYHRYNREQRRELHLSALHPDCNYIDIMEQHFRLLREGHPILKPVYNHNTGDFDAPKYVKPTKFIIIEGLLPFHTRVMRLCFDVKVYLDPLEELRRLWKIKRDTTKRGYTEEQVLRSMRGREDIAPRFIHPQRNYADMIVRFYPSGGLGRADDAGDSHLNAQLVLLPTLPHPDLSDVLARSGPDGRDDSNRRAMRLELARSEGRPADFLQIDGNVSPEKAEELMDIIRGHLPANAGLDESRLGRYQFGYEERRSYPLALTQLLIAYHLITAADQIDRVDDRAVAPPIAAGASVN
jgi:phosphoribulokinase